MNTSGNKSFIACTWTRSYYFVQVLLHIMAIGQHGKLLMPSGDCGLVRTRCRSWALVSLTAFKNFPHSIIVLCQQQSRAKLGDCLVLVSPKGKRGTVKVHRNTLHQLQKHTRGGAGWLGTRIRTRWRFLIDDCLGVMYKCPLDQPTPSIYRHHPGNHATID